MLRIKLDEILSVVLLITIVVIAFLQILFRFVFNLPLDWSEEVARFSFVFLVYLATSLAVKDDKMIKVDLINAFLPKAVKVYFDVIINLACCLFSFVMAFLFVDLVHNATAINQLTPALNWPMSFLYGTEGLLFVLIGIRYIVLFIGDLNEIFHHHQGKKLK